MLGTLSWQQVRGGLCVVVVGIVGACSQEAADLSDAGIGAGENTPEASVPQIPDAAIIHKKALVIDAHADIEIPGKYSRYVGDDGLSQVAPDKMQAGGVDAVVMTIAVGPGPRDEAGYEEARLRADEELAAALALAADPANNTVIATDADAVLAAQAEGQSALILGLQNARILGREVSALEEFYAAGVRVFALTHMGHNDFADSSRPVFIGETGSYEVNEEHGGLSDLGRAAIARINELGGVIDVSQLSKAATLEVLSLSTAPVIASHSNVQALSNVRRNLSDEEILAIAAGGGTIHISAFRGYLFDSNDAKLDADIRAARRVAGIAEDYDYPFELYWEIDDSQIQQTYLSTVSDLLGPGRIEDMIAHIDYVVNLVGIEHVGIGNDFNHGSGIAGYNDASEAQNVTEALLQAGYSEDDIYQLWGQNFLRVMRAAQDGKAPSV